MEDREKDYILKVEMLSFKNEDIEIEAQENSVAITGTAGWDTTKKASSTYAKKEPAKHSTERLTCQKKSKFMKRALLEIKVPKKSPKKNEKSSYNKQFTVYCSQPWVNWRISTILNVTRFFYVCEAIILNSDKMLLVNSVFLNSFRVLSLSLDEWRFKVAVGTNPEFLAAPVDYRDFLAG
jgi:hypothetical protein